MRVSSGRWTAHCVHCHSSIVPAKLVGTHSTDDSPHTFPQRLPAGRQIGFAARSRGSLCQLCRAELAAKLYDPDATITVVVVPLVVTDSTPGLPAGGAPPSVMLVPLSSTLAVEPTGTTTSYSKWLPFVDHDALTRPFGVR